MVDYALVAERIIREIFLRKVSEENASKVKEICVRSKKIQKLAERFVSKNSMNTAVSIYRELVREIQVEAENNLAEIGHRTCFTCFDTKNLEAFDKNSLLSGEPVCKQCLRSSMEIISELISQEK